jgi:predicted Zn-dependent peptidase
LFFVAQEVYQHTFANGLTLLAEPMRHVRSAAFNFLAPAGCAYDPPANLGMASVLSDLMVRGAGKRDSRELSLALDNLGLDRDESAGTMHIRFWGATLARNLSAALDIYADILRRPHLPEEELDPAKSLALQELQSIEDEPRQKVVIELRQRHFPDPLGRDSRGTAAGVEGLTIDALRKHHRRLFTANGTILSVAGDIDWPALRDQVEKLFGDWPAGQPAAMKLGKAQGGAAHLPKETTQTQIALAYPSVPFGDPDYYNAQGAVQVLSGGMGARLFTEVREKRGLCYSVHASYSSFKEHACVVCFAASINERAAETLAVTLDELVRLQEGVTQEEIERVQAGLKTSLIMRQESTSARAAALASDWYYLGRIRTLDEIQAAINALSPKSVVDHVRRFPPRDLTVVTLGPDEIHLPERYRKLV